MYISMLMWLLLLNIHGMVTVARSDTLPTKMASGLYDSSLLPQPFIISFVFLYTYTEGIMVIYIYIYIYVCVCFGIFVEALAQVN